MCMCLRVPVSAWSNSLCDNYPVKIFSPYSCFRHIHTYISVCLLVSVSVYLSLLQCKQCDYVICLLVNFDFQLKVKSHYMQYKYVLKHACVYVWVCVWERVNIPAPKSHLTVFVRRNTMRNFQPANAQLKLQQTHHFISWLTGSQRLSYLVHIKQHQSFEYTDMYICI